MRSTTDGVIKWGKKEVSILFVVASTSFMGSFLGSSLNLALTEIERSFNMDAVTLSWVITAFLLSTALFLLPSGRWGDLFGVSRFFKGGIILFTITSLLCAVAPSGGWLITFRFIEGVSAALTSATGSAILVSSFPPNQRGRVLGISVSGVYLGLAFGPVFGGFLTATFGWHSIFYFATLFGVIASVLAFTFLESERRREVHFKELDLPGIVLFMTGLVALVYGATHATSGVGKLVLLGAILSLSLFVMVEKRASSPILNIKLFTQNHLFAYSNIATLINYSSTYAILFLLSLYLQKVKGLAPNQAGLILVAQPAMMALFSPLTGRLSDRVQPRYLASAGMAICASGLLFFSFLQEETPLWVVSVALLWVGIGFALFSSPNMSTIMGSVSKEYYGVASGTASTMRVVGQMSSMTLVTLLFASLFMGQAVEVVSNALYLKVMQLGFWIFAALSTIGIYFSYYRGEVNR